MSDSIDRVFTHALSTIKRIPRTGSARPPSAERLKLYGLYKQSMEGDIRGVMARPTSSEKGEVEKWDAWAAHHGLSRTAAKRNYIDTLISTMHAFASSTPEARELVGELEFVWEQVRANGAEEDEENSRGDELRVLGPDSEEDDGRNIDDGAGLGNVREEEGMERWQRRMEVAFVNMSAEVAALREVVEAKRGFLGVRPGTRNGWGKWMLWITWIGMRHLFFDALVIGGWVWWAAWRRRRKGKGTGNWIGVWMEVMNLLGVQREK